MPTKEYVQEKINSLKNKISKVISIIDKKTKLIIKKEKVLESLINDNDRFWIECDIKHLKEDILDKEKELKKLEIDLSKWNDELIKIQQTKRDIPVLVEFLNYWKQKAINFYREERNSDDRLKLKKEMYDAHKRYLDSIKTNDMELRLKLWQEYIIKKDHYNNKFNVIITWETKGNFEEEMEKALQKEWEQKYDRLVKDVTKITGTIEYCDELNISDRGELNGVVVGKNGKASITTFIAGGWNIQRTHFRYKVTPIK